MDGPLPRDRLQWIDALRGGVMIIMALDHVRDFVHRGAMSQSPTDLSTTSAALFMTRWITHFCAPVAGSRSATSRGSGPCCTRSARFHSPAVS